MTTLMFFGCGLTAFGPPLALFIFTIARDPVRIIILILSAFFWLLSLLFSSVLWIAVVPLKDQPAFGLAFSVLFQVRMINNTLINIILIMMPVIGAVSIGHLLLTAKSGHNVKEAH